MNHLIELWNLRFHQLVEYKRAHGHCRVLRKVPTLELGTWVGTQRVAKRNNQLSVEREAKLNSIGFVWNACCINPNWDMRFRQLMEYKE
jgi:hypothetical protein